jgi:hypothetical protein
MSRVLAADTESSGAVSDDVRLQNLPSIIFGRRETRPSLCRKTSRNSAWWRGGTSRVLGHECCFVICALFVHTCLAQDGVSVSQAEPVTIQNQLAVNWLYGAYIPKDAPIVALDNNERYRLFIRQSFTTPGIYIKTGFFAIHDQVRDSPPEWGDGFEGLAKRVGTRQAQFLLQNSFTSLGNAMVGWEPRYDRCKCSGFWPRTRHAIARNFVTYDRTEKHLRPQLMPYVGSFGAGVITATWQPGDPDYLVKGYQSALTQAWVGSLINVLGEFAPEITRKLKKHKE